MKDSSKFFNHREIELDVNQQKTKVRLPPGEPVAQWISRWIDDQWFHLVRLARNLATLLAAILTVSASNFICRSFPVLTKFKTKSEFYPPFRDEGEVMASWGEARLIEYLDGKLVLKGDRKKTGLLPESGFLCS